MGSAVGCSKGLDGCRGDPLGERWDAAMGVRANLIPPSMRSATALLLHGLNHGSHLIKFNIHSVVQVCIFFWSQLEPEHLITINAPATAAANPE